MGKKDNSPDKSKDYEGFKTIDKKETVKDQKPTTKKKELVVKKKKKIGKSR